MPTSTPSILQGHHLHRENQKTQAYTHFSFSCPARVSSACRTQGPLHSISMLAFAVLLGCPLHREPRDSTRLCPLQLLLSYQGAFCVYCPRTPHLALTSGSPFLLGALQWLWSASGPSQCVSTLAPAILPGQPQHRVPHNPQPMQATAPASQ